MMNTSKVATIAYLGLAALSTQVLAGDDCPLRAIGSKAAWCSYGLAGGLIPIARTGNDLKAKMPTEYHICLADKFPLGALVTVYHDMGASSAPDSTLDKTHPCGCFTAPVLQVQFAGPVGLPQAETIGGIYQAYVPGLCDKLKAPVKVSEPHEVTAKCHNVGEGSECSVPLTRGKPQDYRLCFMPGYMADRNNAGRVSLRANGFTPVGIVNDPRDPDITISCMDVYRAADLKVVVAKRIDVNETVKIQLQTIYESNPK